MYPTPSVVRRHGGRHAIVVDKGRTLYSVVELTNTRLLLVKRTEAELRRDGYFVTDVSPYSSAERFLKHQAGVSPNAQAALERLAILG